MTTPTPADVAADVIYQALCSYRCAFTQIIDDGGQMPLVDLVSPGRSIETGKQELDELAGYLADAISRHMAPERAAAEARIREEPQHVCGAVDYYYAITEKGLPECPACVARRERYEASKAVTPTHPENGGSVSNERTHQAAEDAGEARIAKLEADNQRLAEIVERLPKTADGVPIHPGLEVFSWNDGEIISNIVGDYTTYVAHGAGGDEVYARWGRESFPGMRFDARADNGFYSTRHAAEAKATQRGGEVNDPPRIDGPEATRGK